MPCPGSVLMSHGVEDPESEYAVEGTAAHALAARCLKENHDAWTYLGWGIASSGEFYTPPAGALADDGHVILVDKEMADAVQVYLDAVRLEHPDRDQGNTWVERGFHCPSIHEEMWGRSDLAHLEQPPLALPRAQGGNTRRLHVWDYKHGAGIVVYVEHNPQLMYYAVGILEDLGLWGTVDEVVLWVAQPRGFLDPIRSWTVGVDELRQWLGEVLLPAMTLAEWVLRNAPDLSHEDLLRMNLLNSGEHCRFCAARYNNCPRHVRDMEEMEELMEKIEGAPKATNEQIGVFLSLFEVAKIRQKAFRETGFARAQDGHEIPGWKLVRAKSNRDWKEGTEAKAKAKFKKDAMVPAELKSPAKIEALPGGKAFAAEYAFKPDAGLQLVPDKDARQEAGPKGRAMFKPVKGGKK